MRRLECLLWGHTKVKHFLGMRTLKENEILPPGWGICWESDYYMERVIAPWGLNLVYSLTRAAYMQVQGWLPLRIDDWVRRDARDAEAAVELERLAKSIAFHDIRGQGAMQRAIRRLKQSK